jgi:hypothetical protein
MLRRGQIIEEGNHPTLLAARGTSCLGVDGGMNGRLLRKLALVQRGIHARVG